MNPSKPILFAVLATFFVSVITFIPSAASAQSVDVEELTRGPIHEAFAATISYDPEPGIFVDQAPPEPIEEIPPDERPVGDNVAWIPGYWAWDEDESDFI